VKKVFWSNPYQESLSTAVASVNGNELLFESSIAYSFAGGQESDRAWINGLPIISSRMEDSAIYYTLPKQHGLSVGDIVTMTIDWPRRTRLMRLHFAAELVLEIVTQKWGFEKLGAHISETKARIDFKCDAPITPRLPEILTAFNEVIDRDVPIEKGYSDIAAQRRFWKIEGFAQVPCGGTHVNSTKEVGYVKLKREHPGKSIERIEIRLVNETPFPSKNMVNTFN
jgi:Ser-tRNA(Ala) deacylase AlaX